MEEKKQRENNEELKYISIIERLVELTETACSRYKKKAKRRSPKRNAVLNAIHSKIKDLKATLNLKNLNSSLAYQENELEMEIFKMIKFLKEQSRITKISHFNNSYFNFNFFCCRLQLTESRLAREIDAILNDPIIKAADQEIVFIDLEKFTNY
jgi:hypothetical protein